LANNEWEVIVDHESGILTEILNSSGIRWADEALDAFIEDRVFGLRRIFAERGSSTYVEFLREHSEPNHILENELVWPWREALKYKISFAKSIPHSA
jgi:hypothetical protein